MSSKIEWTNETWNPVTGCTKVSAGCKNCYAERMAKRLRGRYGYPKDEPFRVTLHPNRLEEPLRWKKPRKIFVNSMSDLFHEDVPDLFIDKIFRIMESTKHKHIYQILTKRPERMSNMLSHSLYFSTNVWLGVSVENQETADERIPLLLKTPAAVRFLSVEPLLGDIDVMSVLLHEPYPQEKIDWIIVGCESGSKKRNCELWWVEDIVKQVSKSCIPIFIKQLNINGKVVKDIEKFPKHLQIREYPKGK